MTMKTGASTRIGIKLTNTFGTAASLGTSDKLECDSFTFKENAEQLRDMPIGSGLDTDNDSIRGATEPSGTYVKKMRFNDCGTANIAQFFGGESVVTQNGTYAHSIIYNASRNNFYSTVIQETCAGSLMEIASMTPTRMNFKMERFPNYTIQTTDMVGNAILRTGTTNNTTTLGNLTVGSTKRVIALASDSFRLNLQSASALSSGDVYEITSAELDLQYPVEFADEMKGSAGNGQPIASGDPPFSGTLTVTFRGYDDKHHRLFINSQSNTQYKADITITSADIIANSIPYSAKWFLPCLIQIEDPTYDLTSTRQNPSTVKFKVLVTTAAPSGMLQGYPHMVIVNDKSTAWIT